MESKQQSARVPFQPGFVASSPDQTMLARGKGQRLAVSNGVMLVDSEPRAGPSFSESSAMGAQIQQRHAEPAGDGFKTQRKAHEGHPAPTSAELLSATGGRDAKPWIRYEAETLAFAAYFTEAVASSAEETQRVRRVVIRIHLSDGTVSITEPRVENSGIPQGVLMKRHRLCKADGTPYVPGDIVVGQTYRIYGQRYHVVDANAFTRRFYAEELGAELAEGAECPVDEFTRRHVQGHGKFNITMNDTKKFVEANLGRGHIDVRASKQFFAQDGNVLRFFAIWEDAASDGEKHPFTLKYYLADDTVEVSMIKQANSGREQFPTMLKRSPLPKDYRSSTSTVASIGASSDADATDEANFVRAGSLRIGSRVNVYGRELLICDCDEFTRAYMRREHGLTDADFAPLQMYDEPARLPRMETPPYNGFGTEEDSLGSFNNLVPRPPRKDLTKLMKLDGKSLRFLAALSDPAVEDTERRFVVTYYMADDTVSIFEKVIRNSGFVGGKFLERSRMRDAAGDFIKPQDFFVGARLTVNRYNFRLLEADEYTLKYMEENDAQFPQASAGRVLKHLSDEGLTADKTSALFAAIDTSGDGRIDAAEFTSALSGAGFHVTPHEVATLMRHFDANADGKIDISEFARGL